MTTINTTNSLVEKVQGLAIDMDLTHEFVQGNENQTVLLGGVPTPTVRKLVKDIDIRESKAAQTVINSAKSQITSEGNKQTDRVLTTGNEQNTRVATTGQVEYDRLIKTGNEQNKRVTDTGDAQNARVYNTGQTQYTNINTMANEQYSKIVIEGGQQVSKINTTGQTQYERLLATGSNERKQLVIIGDEQSTRLTTIVDNSRDELSVYVKEASDHADTAEEAAQRALDMTGVGYASKNNYGICRVGDGIDVDDGVLSVKQQIIISTPVITFPAIVGLGFAYELTMSAETIIPGAHIDHFEVTFGDDPKIDVPAEGDKASVMLTPHGASGVVRRITVTAKDTVGSTSLDGVTTYTQNTVSIAAPRVLFPVDNDVEISLTPTISLQPATITGVSGTPSKTHLQISKTDLFGDDDIVFDTGVVDYKTNIEVPMGSLTIVSNYFIRAKHEFEKYGESAWGQVSRFTTLEAYVNKPSILSPVNGSIDVALQTLFSMSSYATTGLPYVHTGRVLRIYKPGVVDPVFTYPVPLAVPNTYTLPVALDLQAPFQAEIEDTGVFNAETSVAVSDRISFVTVNAYIVKPKILTMNTDIQNVLTMNPFSNIGPVDNLKERVVRYYDATSDTLLHTYHIIPSDQLNFTMPLADVLEFGGSYKVTVEDEGFIWGFSGESDPMLLNTMNPVVAKPVITFPTNGSVDVSLQPTFTFSTYSCDTPGVQLRERRIGLIQPYGEWNESLVNGDIWTPTAALPLLTKMTVKLTDIGTYKGRDIVVVSDVMTFTTVYALPVKPSIVVPVENAVLLAKNATFVVGGPLTEPPTTLIQEAISWKIKDDTNTIINSSGVVESESPTWVTDLSQSLENDIPIFYERIHLLKSDGTEVQSGASGLAANADVAIGGMDGIASCILRVTDSVQGPVFSIISTSGTLIEWSAAAYCGGTTFLVGGRAAGIGRIIYTTNNGNSWSSIKSIGGGTWSNCSVAFCNGIYAICCSGYVSATTNKDSWPNVVVVSSAKSSILNICAGDDRFYGIGNEFFGYSFNGITWVVQDEPILKEAYTKLNYVNGKLFTGRSSGGAYMSSDKGVTWKVIDVQDTSYKNMIAFAYYKGRYIALGNNGNIAVSSDSENWYSIPIARGVNVAKDLCVFNNMVLTGSNIGINYTTDGKYIWGADKVPYLLFSNVIKILHTDKTPDWLIGVGSMDGKCVTLLSQNNGVGWQSTGNQTGKGMMYDIVCNHATVLLCGEQGIVKSTDYGNSWGNPIQIPGFTSITVGAYGNGKFLIANGTGYVSSSTDTNTWSSAVQTQHQKTHWLKAIFANNKFILLSTDGKIATSEDCIAWECSNISVPEMRYTASLYYANGFYCVGSNANTIAYSTDLITWTRKVITQKSYYTIREVCYFNGLFYIFSEGGSSVTKPRITTTSDFETFVDYSEDQKSKTHSWQTSVVNKGRLIIAGGSATKILELRQSGKLSITSENKPTGLPWSETSDPVTFTVQG